MPDKKYILIISTSFQGRTIGLADENGIMDATENLTTNDHLEGTMVQIDALLVKNNLRVAALRSIIADIGPGSFTGLRIGVSTARALAQSLSIPVTGAISLEAMAREHEGPRGGIVAVMKDAKRGRLYAAAYDMSAEGSLLIEPSDIPFTLFAEKLKSLPSANSGLLFKVTGDAVVSYRDQLKALFPALTDADLFYRQTVPAIGLFRCWKSHQANSSGESTGYQSLMPLYLRKSDAETMREKHG